MIVGFGHLGVYDLGVFKVCRKLFKTLCVFDGFNRWLVGLLVWFGWFGVSESIKNTCVSLCFQALCCWVYGFRVWVLMVKVYLKNIVSPRASRSRLDLVGSVRPGSVLSGSVRPGSESIKNTWCFNGFNGWLVCWFGLAGLVCRRG